MSTPQSIDNFRASLNGTRPEIRAAIARAADRTGVDFDYLLAQARIESGLNPAARAATSSAAGLYQFTRGTWLQTLDRHGADHGLGWAQDAIRGGRVADPALRAQILALRHDPVLASAMAGELAADNRATLAGQLGREPDAAELYLAHFLGVGGAGQMLSALQASPDRSAAALFPDAAAANRAIFFERGGAPRTVAGVMEVIRSKVATAMAADGGGEMPGMAWAELAAAAPALPGPIGAAAPGAFGLADLAPAPVPDAAARPSMAEVLRHTFGLEGDDAAPSAPRFVHAAYGRLRSMGL